MRNRSGWMVAVSLLCASCSGAGGAVGPDGTGDSLSPEEKTALDAEVGRVQQGLGEATCASTSADATLGGTTVVVDSKTNTYDHPTCRDGYVVDVPGMKAGQEIAGGPILGTPGQLTYNFFTCLVNVGFLYLYEKRGSTYVAAGQTSAFGVVGALGVCSGLAHLSVPRDGDYKAVVAGVTLFGPKLPVRVTRTQ